MGIVDNEGCVRKSVNHLCPTGNRNVREGVRHARRVSSAADTGSHSGKCVADVESARERKTARKLLFAYFCIEGNTKLTAVAEKLDSLG